MPGADLERALECVVVGGAYAIELNNGAEVGEWNRSRVIRLIDIAHDIQLPRLGAHIPDLEYGCFAKTLLDLQVVFSEVRRAEVLVHTEQIEAGRARAQGISTGDNAGKDLLVCLPGIRSLPSDVFAVGGDWSRTKRIALYPLRCRNGRTEIQEGVHINLVEIDSKTAAQNQIATVSRLIGKAEARCEVVVVGWEDGVNSIPLNNQSSSRNEHRQVLFVTVQGTKVFIA